MHSANFYSLNIMSSSTRATSKSSATTIIPSQMKWVKNRGKYFLFSIVKSTDSSETEQGIEMIEFNVKGIVINTFLSSKAKSHTIFIQLTSENIAAIKTLIRTSPEFHETNSYRWPFVGTHAKFTSKDDIGDEYQSVWNGRGVKDLNNPDNRHKISADMINDGSQVMIEYSLVPYLDLDRKDGESFQPGCTLKLLSIGLLKDENQKYNFESPRKKRRMRE